MEYDLAFIWAMVIAFAVLAYVILDGFDLGIGLRQGHGPDICCELVEITAAVGNRFVGFAKSDGECCTASDLGIVSSRENVGRTILDFDP